MIYRTKKITVRLTDKEYAKLREMSETSGLKMEPVIRKLLVGYEIRPRPNATYIKLIKELSAVGNNLNQIAHLANATGKITEDQWKKTHQLLEKIWDFCAYELDFKRLFEKRPTLYYTESTDISRKRWSEQMNMENLIGETTEYDKKAALEVKKPKSWCKSVSAFANTLGGALIFGMADDGQIVGLTEPNSDAEKISEIIRPAWSLSRSFGCGFTEPKAASAADP